MCTCVYVNVCMYRELHRCCRRYLDACVYVCIHVRMHNYMYVCTSMYVYTCVYMYVCTSMYVYMSHVAEYLVRAVTTLVKINSVCMYVYL
jgi:hypothetical protein